MGKALYVLGGTVGIGTVKADSLFYGPFLRKTSADGTCLRNLKISALCHILSDLWNDHIGFIYTDLISDTKL